MRLGRNFNSMDSYLFRNAFANVGKIKIALKLNNNAYKNKVVFCNSIKYVIKTLCMDYI